MASRRLRLKYAEDRKGRPIYAYEDRSGLRLRCHPPEDNILTLREILRAFMVYRNIDWYRLNRPSKKAL